MVISNVDQLPSGVPDHIRSGFCQRAIDSRGAFVLENTKEVELVKRQCDLRYAMAQPCSPASRYCKAAAAWSSPLWNDVYVCLRHSILDTTLGATNYSLSLTPPARNQVPIVILQGDFALTVKWPCRMKGLLISDDSQLQQLL